MTLADKELLFKDLSARLPYGVHFSISGKDEELVELSRVIAFVNGGMLNDKHSLQHCKPYLRPMSSMTEEEKKELLQISNFDSDVDDICYDSICCIERTSIDIADIANFISWLNAHHFDYRGLIPKGLAIEITEENNPYKT